MHVKTDAVELVNGKDVAVFLVNSDISTQKHPLLCNALVYKTILPTTVICSYRTNELFVTHLLQ